MQKKDVKANLLDHSRAKVLLLQEYLKRYLGVLSNVDYNERIRIYDVFCGEGLYNDGGEGSPLVILKAIKELHDSKIIRGRIPPIDCYFNDINPDKIEKLRKVIEDQGLHKKEWGVLEFSTIDYVEKVKEIQNLMPQLRKEKVFIFIDPYDYKHIKASDISNLIKSKNSEVLLWQPTQFMYRFEQNGTPQALKDFIEELVPFEQWKDSESALGFIEQLKEAFRNYLGDEYYVDTFTIQKDPRTLFCLFFFSSHIKGFEKMVDAKWEIDESQGRGWHYEYSRYAGGGLFGEFKTFPLEEKLKTFLKESRSNGEVYKFTLQNGFRTTHATQILIAWGKGGEVETKTVDGANGRKNSFYITYDNYRDSPKKIKIKRK